MKKLQINRNSLRVILATAYDINPYKGSESATGWNFIIQIARFNKVIAITRKNNREAIELYIKEFRIDDSNIELYYFDLPYYLRFWKKGSRGSSLYFYLWQMFMPLFVKRKKINFDIAHNVNFHADAFPSFLWLLRKPLVWGPINHHEYIPRQYIKFKKEYIKDRIKWFVKQLFWHFNPFLLICKLKANIIIGGNSSVQKRLKISSNKFIALTQVASSVVSQKKRKDLKNFNVIIAARFVTLKGVDIALLAFDKFYNQLSNEEKKRATLTILGQGPLENYLRAIRNTLKSKNNIEFIGWIEKEKMDVYYQNANVFLFPSHEGAGMVVIEALSFGLPIICFDNYGPGELVNHMCALKIKYTDYDQSIKDYSNSLMDLFLDKELSNQLSKAAYELFEEKYTWEKKGLQLKRIYEEILIKN